jgi:O-antigen/teichoic acid export membrane protein
MNTLHRAIRETTLFSGVQGVVFMLSLVSFPILTRLLTIAEYGMLALVNTTAMLLIGLAKCGLSTAYLRDHATVAADDAAKRATLVTTSFVLALALALGVAGLYWVGTIVFGAPGGVPAKLVPFIALTVVAVACRDLYYGYVRAEGRMWAWAAVTLSLRFGAAALGLTLCALFADRLVGYFLGSAGWEFLLVAAFWSGPLLLRRIDFSLFSGPMARRLIFYGAPLVVFEFSSLTNDYGNRFLIAHYLGVEQVGVFSVGYNLASYLNLGLVMPMWQAIFPILTRVWEQEGRAATEELLSRLLQIYTFAGGAIMLIVATNGHELVTLLASAKFAEAAVVFVAVCAVMVAYGSTWIFAAGFYLQRKTGQLAVFMAAAAVLNLALSVLLVPRFGIMGAVAATVGSYGALTFNLIRGGRRHARPTLPLRTLASCVLAAVAVGALLSAVTIDNLVVSIGVKLVTGGAFYGGLVIAFDRELRALCVTGWRWGLTRLGFSGAPKRA